jgi:hypothetical protein
MHKKADKVHLLTVKIELRTHTMQAGKHKTNTIHTDKAHNEYCTVRAEETYKVNSQSTK